jgi:hypothetical protein
MLVGRFTMPAVMVVIGAAPTLAARGMAAGRSMMNRLIDFRLIAVMRH